MTPTPPAQEIATLQGRIMYCVREMRRNGASSPAIQAWADYLEDQIIPAITAETQARQQVEADAIGSRDDLAILKVKHAADVLARQQAEHSEQLAIARCLELEAQLTLSEQARAQAEQARDRSLAFIAKIAAIGMCSDESEKASCYLGSGPYCGAHGDLCMNDEITEARALITDIGPR